MNLKFKIINKIKIYFVLFVMLFSFIPGSEAKNLTSISDFISTSQPGYPSSHTIKFKTTETVPPGGKIRIIPDDAFLLQSGFDYSDIDLATSSIMNFGWQDRNLATTSTAFSDGVSIYSVGSSTNIDIVLNLSKGIASSTFVRIDLGAIANYGELGDKYIINPATSTSYGLEVQTLTSGDRILDRSEPMIFITKAIKMTNYMPKIRSHGSPSGTLAQGTNSTILSLITNYNSDCRYSIASNTDYTLMPDDFSYNGAYFHSQPISGLLTGVNSYYVRCQDDLGINDIDDYEIFFYVLSEGESPSGEGDTATSSDGVDDGVGSDDGDVSGSGGTGGSGSGGGGGGGAGASSGRFDPYDVPLEDPSVELSGWAYPNSEVHLLQDSVDIKNVRANSSGFFTFEIMDIPRGTYTFGLWAKDADQRKSLTYNTTFYLEDGTRTSVSDIFISPTVYTGQNSIDPGAILSTNGFAKSGSEVESWLYPVMGRNLRDEEIIKNRVLVGSDGRWQLDIDTADSLGGQYRLKARAYTESFGYSEFSYDISIGLGEPVEIIMECANGDLNGDGKVSIVDFSIMLYHWGGDNSCADQNDSGYVDLVDFSIMMFYWTG